MTELAKERSKLGTQVAGKHRIYLDTRFWIYLRDVQRGISGSPDYEELFRALTEAVETGTVICPVEQNTLLETLNQPDQALRIETARTIDTFSQKVAIVTPEERVFVEVLTFVLASGAGRPFPPAPLTEVWTRASYLIGHGEFHSEELSEAQLAALNALFQDVVWDLGLEDLMRQLPDEIPPMQMESTVEALNRNKLLPTTKYSSKRKLYMSEIRGALEAFEASLLNVLEYIYATSTGRTVRAEEREAFGAGKGLIELLSRAFAKHDLSKQLPTCHVLATLYTDVQWDTTRRYKVNDIADFWHAAAALPYYDAFFTERSLTSLIVRTGLDDLYGTTVIRDVAQAAEHIRSLN